MIGKAAGVYVITRAVDCKPDWLLVEKRRER